MEKSPPISETAVIQERKFGEYGVSGGGGGGRRVGGIPAGILVGREGNSGSSPR
jgi:hypothetical protein